MTATHIFLFAITVIVIGYIISCIRNKRKKAKRFDPNKKFKETWKPKNSTYL